MKKSVPDEDQDPKFSTLRKQLSALDLISHLLTTSKFDLDVLLNKIVRVAAEELHMKGCAIRLLNEETQEMVLRGAYGLGPEYLGKGPVFAAKSAMREVIESGGITELFDVSQDSRIQYSKEAIAEGICSMLTVGLLRDDRAIGALSVYTDHPHHFTDEEIRTFEAIANQAAVAVHLTQLHITERKRDEKVLRRSEAQIRAILDTVIDGIITIDERGVVASFNPGAVRIFGYKPEEVIGQNISILMPEPDSSQHSHHLSNYLRTGKAKIIGIGREVLGRRKDGTTFPMYLGVENMRIGGRRMFTGVVRDLTDLKRMQDQMLQSESLAAIGEMAALLAHEIKNPLAGISGAIEVLRESLKPGDQRREVMEAILEQVKRLDQCVRQLLMLSKPWKPEKQLCDLRELVQDLSSSAKEQKTFAQVDFVFKGIKSSKVPVDPSFLEQVLWNLLHNAVEAMSEGGEICYTFGQGPGFATIIVADKGCGIPPEFQDQLFRPFFTTKTRGTGLGLPICKKIMDAHAGSITISSEVDRGTEVTLRFPKGT